MLSHYFSWTIFCRWYSSKVLIVLERLICACEWISIQGSKDPTWNQVSLATLDIRRRKQWEFRCVYLPQSQSSSIYKRTLSKACHRNLSQKPASPVFCSFPEHLFFLYSGSTPPYQPKRSLSIRVKTLLDFSPLYMNGLYFHLHLWIISIVLCIENENKKQQ